MALLADFAGAQAQGFQQGQQMAGPNPLGIFVKNMLADYQQKKAAQQELDVKSAMSKEDARNKAYGSIIQNASPSSMTYSDRATGKMINTTASSTYAPEVISSAYKALGMQEPNPQPTQPTQSTNPIVSSMASSTDTSTQTSQNDTTQQNQLPIGASIVRSGGKTKITPPTAGVSQIQQRKSNAKDIADGIMKGITPVDPTVWGGMAGKQEVAAEMSRRGVDFDKMYTNWLATKKMIGTLNSTQQTRLRQSFDSVENSIPVLRNLSSELDRTGFVPANRLIIGAELNGVRLGNTNGMSKDQVSAATKYVTQMNLMRDELAQGFSSGNAPTIPAFRLADDILNQFYGKEQIGSALDQLEVNLRIRRNAIENTSPLGVNGPIGSNQNQSPVPGMSQSSGSNIDYKAKYGLK